MNPPLNTMVKQWAIDIWTSRGPGWHLVVGEDGRGQLDWGPAENVRFPAGTFNFAKLVNAVENQSNEPTSDGYAVRLVRREVVVASAEASQETNQVRRHPAMKGLRARRYGANTTLVASVFDIARRAIQNGKLDEPGYESRFGKKRKRDLTSLYRTWNANAPTPISKPLAHRES